MNRWEGLLVAISAISTSLVLSFVLHAPWGAPNIYNDITGSFWGRCWVQSGSLPYIPVNSGGCDYAFEYPTISGLVLYGARLFGANLFTFYNAVSAFTLVAAVVVAAGTWGISRRLGKKLDPLYFMMPTFIVYGIYNFDMFHAAFVVMSVLSFMTGRKSLSAAFLGLGVDTKLTSVVLLPVFLMEIRSDWPPKGIRDFVAKGPPLRWRKKLRALPQRSKVLLLGFKKWFPLWLKANRLRWKYVGIFALFVVAVNLPFVLLNWRNFLEGYTFVSNFGLEDSWYVWIFQNTNSWGLAKIFGLGISGLLLLRIYSLRLSLVPKSALAIAAYLLGTYIYSPQLNIVLIPLLAAIELRHPALYTWDGFNALIILTWFISPSFVLGGPCPGLQSTCPTLAGTWPQLFALVRSGCLALLCVAVASNEGHSLSTWVMARFRRARPTAGSPAASRSSLP